MQPCILFLLILLTSSTTVTISSQSEYVGELTTYILVFESHNNPSTIQTIFSSWSPNEQNPYQSDYKFYLQSGSSQQVLACKLRFSGTIIECELPQAPQTLSLRITSIRNPSSTKPYQIDFNLISTSTESVTGFIQVEKVQEQPIILASYNNEIGKTSSQVIMFMNFDYYITSTTILKLQYDENLISINFNPSLNSGYAVLNHTGGTAYLTDWIDFTLGSHTVPEVTIINPEAAITYSITGLLYYEQSNTTFQIQAYTYTVTLQSVTFTTITATSSLEMGSLDQTIEITELVCPFNGVSPETYVSFPIDEIVQSSCNNEVTNSTSKLCTFSGGESLTISQVTPAISNENSISFNIQLETFFNNVYYPLCYGQFSISLTEQTISKVLFDTSVCAHQAGETNSQTELYIQVQNYEEADTVVIEGIEGTLLSSWDSNTYTISSQNVHNESYVVIPLTYSNPTYLTTNKISKIQVNRPSLGRTYSTYTSEIEICEVSEGVILPFMKVTLDSSLTFQSTTYTISFLTSFSDYEDGDIITIEMINNEYAFSDDILITVNDASKSFFINGQTIQIIDGVSTGVTSYNITLENVLNPIYLCSTCALTVSLYTALSQLKQYRTFSLSFEANTISLQIDPLPILTTTNLTVTLTQEERSLYPSTISSNVSLTLPFTCDNADTENWSGNDNEYIISLTNCNIGYLLTESIEVQEKVNSIQSSTGSESITLLCPQNCQYCDSECTQCVNSTYSASIYLYAGLCYDSCPEGTFLPVQQESLCSECHVSCKSCETGNTLTDCLQCKENFVKADSGFCISTCGIGQYYNTQTNQCQQCHPNCDVCINGQYCYVCKELAIMIADGYCELQDCEENCATCEGQVTNCIQCLSGMYLYESDCYVQCPSETYVEGSSCKLITTPLLYFPVTICSVILITMACLCNCCNNKKHRVISLISYSSCILAYMQLVGIFIIVLLTTTENYIIGYVGIGLWFLANLIFSIYYCKSVGEDAKKIIQKMSSKSKCVYYTALILSFLFTLRTYRALYSGLFKGVATYLIEPANQNKPEIKSESQITDCPSSIFLLNDPVVIFATILSLVGSILFLVTAVLEVLDNFYINMLFWGIDLLVVGVLSAMATVSDMWIGKKRGQYKAELKENNQTVENLNDYVEQMQKTEEKIAKPIITIETEGIQSKEKKQMFRKKIKKSKIAPDFKSRTIDKTNDKKEKKVKEKTKSAMSNKRAQKVERQVEDNESVIQKQYKIGQKFKTIESQDFPSRYESYLKEKEKSSQESDEQVPNIKMFDQTELYLEEKKKVKKREVKSGQKKYQTTANFRKSQMKKKGPDIFVNLDEEDKKTVVKGKIEQSMIK